MNIPDDIVNFESNSKSNNFFNKINKYISDQKSLNSQVSIQRDEKNILNNIFIQLDTYVVKGESDAILDFLITQLKIIKEKMPSYFEVQWCLINMITEIKSKILNQFMLILI